MHTTLTLTCLENKLECSALNLSANLELDVGAESAAAFDGVVDMVARDVAASLALCVTGILEPDFWIMDMRAMWCLSLNSRDTSACTDGTAEYGTQSGLHATSHEPNHVPCTDVITRTFSVVRFSPNARDFADLTWLNVGPGLAVGIEASSASKATVGAMIASS